METIGTAPLPPAITVVTALSVAHDLEQAYIERRYYDVVEGEGPELEELLLRLEIESTQHRAMLRQAWDEERRRG